MVSFANRLNLVMPASHLPAPPATNRECSKKPTGGCFFLDEIGEIPPASQAKLLRAVETREIQRVGATASRKVDVRIVCATNRNLQHEVEKKAFREDLFFQTLDD